MPRALSTVALALAALSCCVDAKAKYNTRAKIVRGAINVHLVPHSHDDVGWLKTVDEYATGANNSIQHTNTNLEYDTVMQCLALNPDRKFIAVEQAFFQRWMDEADDDQLDVVQRVVQRGQLEFVNGGWCMHDEAAPSYVDMIDNTGLGHRMIASQFGVSAVPRATWQIDPFGHTATQASLLSSPLGGFSSVFVGRIDFQDRAARQNASSLETIWRASPTLGASAQTLYGMMPGYGPIKWCWDEVACNGGDIPVLDDPRLEDYNVPYFINQTVEAALAFAVPYRPDADGTVHLIWPMGSDFQYVNAFGWYKNLDRLIHHVNAGQSAVNLLYSTPSIYAEAKLGQNMSWPLKTDDGMPYFDGPHAVWSGYFTSRSALKAYVRSTSAVYQAAKQLQFFASPPTDMGPTNPLYRLERAMGVTQHHDSVSGTSKQHVAYDYARRLAWGREDAAAANALALAALTKGFAGAFATCDLANATICPALESPVAGAAVLVLAYAQQAAAAAAAPFRIPVALPAGVASYAVAGPDGAAVTAQLIPATAADLALRTGYYGAPAAAAMAWLVWQGPLPAAGAAAYFVTPSATAVQSTHVSTPVPMAVRGARVGARLRDQQITNGVITLTISAATGMVSSYANAATGVSTPLAQSFGWWNSSIGEDAPADGTSDQRQSSGAYIFRPNSSTLFPVSGAPATVAIVTGPVVSEAQQVVADGWVTQTVRLWAGAPFADFEWTIGPIPRTVLPGTQPQQGKEVIARYATPMATAGMWKTDSNCREMQLRKRAFRPSWNYTTVEPIAGEYVPVNCRITTADVNTGTTLSIVVDRSQGGASLIDGSVELMVQRRLQHDDSRGVGEPLNETGLDASGAGLIVRGVHRLSVDTAAAAAPAGKRTVQDMLFPTQLTFSPLAAGGTPASWLAAHPGTVSGLAAPLPANVHLLTTQAQSPSTLLLRLAHLFEAGEDAALSQPAVVSLTGLFAKRTLSGCVETTTPGVAPLATVPVRTVKIEGEGAVTWPALPAAPAGPAQTVTINPMEVRTWLCDFVSA